MLGYSFGAYVLSCLPVISHLATTPFSTRVLLWSQFTELGFKLPEGYFHSVDGNTEP